MTQKILLAASIVFIVAGVVLHIVRSQQPELPPNTIALVNGYPVVAEELAVDRQKMAAAMREALGRDPSDEELLKSVKSFQALLVRERLAKQVCAAAIEEYGIEVTDEEVHSAVLKLFPKLAEEPEAVLERETKLDKARVAALREAVAEPEREREIYEQHLKDMLGYQRWQMEFQHYREFPDKINEIESNLPGSVDDIIKRCEQMLRPQMIDQKLKAQIAGKIEVSEEELSQSYAELVKRAQEQGTEAPELEKVQLFLQWQAAQAKLQRAYGAWLNGRLAELKIELKDESFAELFARAIKPVSNKQQTQQE